MDIGIREFYINKGEYTDPLTDGYNSIARGDSPTFFQGDRFTARFYFLDVVSEDDQTGIATALQTGFSAKVVCKSIKHLSGTDVAGTLFEVATLTQGTDSVKGVYYEGVIDLTSAPIASILDSTESATVVMDIECSTTANTKVVTYQTRLELQSDVNSTVIPANSQELVSYNLDNFATVAQATSIASQEVATHLSNHHLGVSTVTGAVPVIWTNLTEIVLGSGTVTAVGTVQADSGGGLEKIAGVGGYNAGASSVQQIGAGKNGYAQFQWATANKSVRIGLVYIDDDYADADPFELRIEGTGSVVGDGMSKGTGWASPADWFRIRHYAEDNRIHFQKKINLGEVNADLVIEAGVYIKFLKNWNAGGDLYVPDDVVLITGLSGSGDPQFQGYTGTRTLSSNRGTHWEAADFLGQDFVTFHIHTQTTANNSLYLDTSLYHIGSRVNDCVFYVEGDTDADGLSDDVDTDDDGDGIPDSEDADHPDNAGQADADGDGVIDSAQAPTSNQAPTGLSGQQYVAPVAPISDQAPSGLTGSEYVAPVAPTSSQAPTGLAGSVAPTSNQAPTGISGIVAPTSSQAPTGITGAIAPVTGYFALHTDPWSGFDHMWIKGVVIRMPYQYMSRDDHNHIVFNFNSGSQHTGNVSSGECAYGVTTSALAGTGPYKQWEELRNGFWVSIDTSAASGTNYSLSDFQTDINQSGQLVMHNPNNLTLTNVFLEESDFVDSIYISGVRYGGNIKKLRSPTWFLYSHQQRNHMNDLSSGGWHMNSVNALPRGTYILTDVPQYPPSSVSDYTAYLASSRAAQSDFDSYHQLNSSNDYQIEIKNEGTGEVLEAIAVDPKQLGNSNYGMLLSDPMLDLIDGSDGDWVETTTFTGSPPAAETVKISTKHTAYQTALNNVPPTYYWMSDYELWETSGGVDTSIAGSTSSGLADGTGVNAQFPSANSKIECKIGNKLYILECRDSSLHNVGGSRYEALREVDVTTGVVTTIDLHASMMMGGGANPYTNHIQGITTDGTDLYILSNELGSQTSSGRAEIWIAKYVVSTGNFTAVWNPPANTATTPLLWSGYGKIEWATSPVDPAQKCLWVQAAGAELTAFAGTYATYQDLSWVAIDPNGFNTMLGGVMIDQRSSTGSNYLNYRMRPGASCVNSDGLILFLGCDWDSSFDSLYGNDHRLYAIDPAMEYPAGNNAKNGLLMTENTVLSSTPGSGWLLSIGVSLAAYNRQVFRTDDMGMDISYVDIDTGTETMEHSSSSNSYRSVFIEQ